MYFLNRNTDTPQSHISGQGEDDPQILAATDIIGQSGDDKKFLASKAIFLCILSFFGLLMEVLQLKNTNMRYLMNPDNYFRLALYILTLIFIVSLVKSNDNWCSTTWQWQIGAFAVFLSWVNFIFILRYISYTAIPINMFLSICVAFLKLIFLPILLILAFAMPFYMVFVKVSCLGHTMDNILFSLIPRPFIKKRNTWQLTQVLSWSCQYQSDFRTLHVTVVEFQLHCKYITYTT